MCGKPITHTGTEQLAGVCDSCFSLQAERNTQEELSRSVSEILAYAEEHLQRPSQQVRLVASALAHTEPFVTECKDGDYCIYWCVYRPWRVPFDGNTPEGYKALRNWKWEAYARDLRITAPTTHPTKRDTDKIEHYTHSGGFCLVGSGITKEDLPSLTEVAHRAEVDVRLKAEVDAWLADRNSEHKRAEEAEGWQYGRVKGSKPKALHVPEALELITHDHALELPCDVYPAYIWRPATFTSREPHAVRYTLHEQQQAKSATWVDLGHVEEINTAVKSKPALDACEVLTERNYRWSISSTGVLHRVDAARRALRENCSHGLGQGTCYECLLKVYSKDELLNQALDSFQDCMLCNTKAFWRRRKRQWTLCLRGTLPNRERDCDTWEVVSPTLGNGQSAPLVRISSTSKEALKLARYFSEPRDLPYDSATEQPAIKELAYFLPSTTKPLGVLYAELKRNKTTKAWTLRRRWSVNGKRDGEELYLGRVMSEPKTVGEDGRIKKAGEYIDRPSLEQFVQHCWEQTSLAKDGEAWLQWFCKVQALRMTGASGTDYGTEDTSKEDALRQQLESLDTSYSSNRDLNGDTYAEVSHAQKNSPTFVDDALDDERVSLGELSKTLRKQEKTEETQPKDKPEQAPEPETVAEEVKPKPRYAFRSAYGPRLIPKKLEGAKVMCAECSQPRAVNRFNQQTEWMKLRCGHQRFLCVKCNGKCQCKATETKGDDHE
jgi:hypothetical protein